MSYMKSKPQVVFDIMIFTDKTALTEYLKSNTAELLITCDEDIIARANEWKIDKYIKLLEERFPENKSEALEYQPVFKYQSTENIIKEMLSYCSIGANALKINTTKSTGHILGVYSPIGRCGKTFFSMALAQLLGKNKRVLYLNLEEFSGLFSGLLKKKVYGLSELLYIYRRSSDGFGDRLSQAICTLGSFDYIPPAQCPEDVAEVLSEEWVTFCNYLAEYTEYDYLVIDVGSLIKKPVYLLGIMNEIFVPYVEDDISEGKIREFTDNLKNMGRTDIPEAMVMLKVPWDEVKLDENFFTEKIEWSRIGGFVRKVINERGL